MPTKVSVITAVYNRVGSILQAVESVQSQSHENVEHLVIDGESTDGTLEALSSWLARHRARREAHNGEGIRFARPFRLISGPDEGIYDALNKGIERATGEVIGLMHSDDYYADEHVLRDVAKAFVDPQVDAVYGDVVFFRRERPERTVRRYRSDRFSPAMLARGLMPAHTALFLRRRVFERYGRYRTDYQIAADFEFVARIFGSDTLRSVYLPRVLVRMCMGGVSTGGWRNTVVLNQEVLRACQVNGIRTNMLKICSKYPMKALEFLRP